MKGLKDLPCDWVGIKQRKKTGGGVGPAPLGRKLKKRKGPCAQEAPLLAEIWPPGQKESFRGSEGGRNHQFATGRTERTMQRWLAPLHCCAPAREPHPLAQAGWNSGFRGHPGEDCCWLWDSLKGQECITATTLLGLGVGVGHGGAIFAEIQT